MKNLVLLTLIVSISVYSKYVKVTLEPGQFWHQSFKVAFVKINTTPQFAIWLEERNGEFLKTIFVTAKTAKDDFKGLKVSRPSSLPVWAHKRNIKNERGTYIPTRKMPLEDVYTGASPTSECSYNIILSDSLFEKGVVVCIEVNQSMDFNTFFKKDLPKNSPYYNNSVNGQPSLVYKALISNKAEPVFKLVGHGSSNGDNGKLTTDLKNITTAKKLIQLPIISFDSG